VARIEATTKGMDVRYVVSSLRAGARHLLSTPVEMPGSIKP
jgi:hypothetical protein